MASLQEIMAQVGLAATGQTKEASAAKPAATEEVSRVLADLGLNSAETVKTASENVENNKGEDMSSLAQIWEQTVGAAPAVTKTAAAAEAAPAAAAAIEKTASEQAEGVTAFGSLVGGYFTEAFDSFVKSAADLEVEAGKGEKPQEHAPGGGGMTAVIGKEGDPALPQNHSASSGAPLKVTTHGNTPYSLAVQQSVLKRFKGQGIVGEQK